MSITIIIIILTVVTSLSAFNNDNLMNKLMMNPYTVYHQKEWWRFITSGLVHLDYVHLALNMFVLYSFGNVLEIIFAQFFGEMGKFYFIGMYILSLIASDLTTFKRNINNYHYNTLGASGAVSAVIFAYIMILPFSPMYVYFIEMPALLFGVIYLLAEFYLDRQKRLNINHMAHIEGALFGIVFIIIAKPSVMSSFIEQIRLKFF